LRYSAIDLWKLYTMFS